MGSVLELDQLQCGLGVAIGLGPLGMPQRGVHVDCVEPSQAARLRTSGVVVVVFRNAATPRMTDLTLFPRGFRCMGHLIDMRHAEELRG